MNGHVLEAGVFSENAPVVLQKSLTPIGGRHLEGVLTTYCVVRNFLQHYPVLYLSAIYLSHSNSLTDSASNRT